MAEKLKLERLKALKGWSDAASRLVDLEQEKITLKRTMRQLEQDNPWLPSVVGIVRKGEGVSLEAAKRAAEAPPTPSPKKPKKDKREPTPKDYKNALKLKKEAGKPPKGDWAKVALTAMVKGGVDPDQETLDWLLRNRALEPDWYGALREEMRPPGGHGGKVEELSDSEEEEMEEVGTSKCNN